MATPAGPERRMVRTRSYFYFLLIFGALLFLMHLSLLQLPYFWDEALYYIPSALDLFHSGSLIPHSVTPLVHPPGVAVYLTFWWTIAGCHPVVTRIAILALCSFGVLVVFLL